MVKVWSLVYLMGLGPTSIKLKLGFSLCVDLCVICSPIEIEILMNKKMLLKSVLTLDVST
jgi:hypothetical protein